METPEQEAARVRAEVVEEMQAEESGAAPVVDVDHSKPKEEETKKTGIDPWEGVSPALKQAFNDMSSRVSTLQATETRLKQAESRIGAITNELHTVRKTAEKVSPTKEQVEAAAADDEKWESLKKDFPEWAEAFDGRFDKKLTTKLDQLREDLKTELKATGDNSPNLDLRLLGIIKPKWRETVASNEWKEWLALQPQEARALVSSDRAEDAIALISSFENANVTLQKTATEIAAERKERLKKANLPVGGKATPVKSEADMTADELRANIGKEIFAET